jgi:glyoxylase-like metal-dependent hydrolase (beta-lactamase superfamily II)
MSDAIYHFNVGKFECSVFKAGGGPRPASSLFSDAPQEELEKAIRKFDVDPADLPFSMNVVLVKTGDHVVLIDTGLPTSNIAAMLLAEGVDPSTVDTIIITHGHGDHVGGILDDNGEFVYPNARYILWKSEWDYWTDDERLGGDPNPAKARWAALKAHQDRVTTIGGDVDEAEAMPGFCGVATPGHTVGHMALLIESDGEKLLHIADAAHQPFQMICPQWSPNFDYDKGQAAVTRDKLFKRAAREHLPLLAYHFVYPGLGQVTGEGDDLGWQAKA